MRDRTISPIHRAEDTLPMSISMTIARELLGQLIPSPTRFDSKQKNSSKTKKFKASRGSNSRTRSALKAENEELRGQLAQVTRLLSVQADMSRSPSRQRLARELVNIQTQLDFQPSP